MPLLEIIDKTNVPLEILVATQNRTNMDFLDDMFKHSDVDNLAILIINQTSKDKLLQSSKRNIRVINSFEKGISKSRNLAINNAIGDVCLFADDDVVYEKDFEKIILEGFNHYKGAVMINFKATDLNGKNYRNYPKSSKIHDLKSLKRILSIEIAFKRVDILNVKQFFDERFGLNGQFETGEEYLFARGLIASDLCICFYDKAIVSHDKINSGIFLGSDKIVYARAALNYKLHKGLVYFWIPKYVLFLINNNYIKLQEILSKYRLALKAIKDFKESEK